MKVLAVHDVFAVGQSKYSVEIAKWLWYLVILGRQWESPVSDSSSISD